VYPFSASYSCNFEIVEEEDTFNSDGSFLAEWKQKKKRLSCSANNNPTFLSDALCYVMQLRVEFYCRGY
jgi:hypothetical protein